MTLLEAATHLLREDERDIILGDLLEANASTLQSLQSIAGLLLRRQLEPWRNWRPWLAAASALAASLLLLGASFSLSVRAQALLPTSPTPLARQAILLLLWAWTAGCMIAFLAKRTWYASAILCLIPCLSCTLRFHSAVLSPFSVLLFLAPGLLGAWRGARREPLSFAAAITLAAASTYLTLTWSGATAWALPLVLPSWFLVANTNPFHPNKQGLAA